MMPTASTYPATKEEIEREVARLGALQPWNHDFSLPYEVQTRPEVQRSHGKNLVKWARIKPLLDQLHLEGKKVLDVGCNEGFFSCQLASMGAEVAGIDVDPHRIEKARYVSTLLGSPQPSYSVVDIYSPEFGQMGPFDVCLCMGFLHRVPDPFSAMSRLAQKSNVILFEWKALKFGPHDDAFAYFSPKPIDEQDYFGTEYWLLSYQAVERIAQRLGFKYFHRVDDPEQRRAILLAGKSHAPVFDTPDVIYHRGRTRALLSHTKRYVRTVLGVLTGRVNA